MITIAKSSIQQWPDVLEYAGH